MKTHRERPLILLLGKDGQIGSELRHTVAPLAELVAWGRKEANLAHPDQIRDLVDDLKPDVIVNAAAYTAVDRAEKERDLAFAVNGKSPGVLAEVAKRNQSHLVHYSTDYVFDGTQNDPYSETGMTSAINAYGASKLAGEEAIQTTGCDHFIFRTTWVYSWSGNNFLNAMLRLGRDRDELSVVNDQFGAPTWSRMIAETTALVLSQAISQPDSIASGIYNMSAGGRTSWHGFAEEIFRLAQSGHRSETNLKVQRVRAIPSADYPTAAKRPVNSELTHEKLWETFHLRLPHWKDSLTAMMASQPQA